MKLCGPVLVSTIITTHNRLYLLKKAIQSVLAQDYKPIECIVVDDASTDETKEYCSQSENVRYIRIEPDESKGGNYARNKGIKASAGNYIAFLDDDDEWLPEKTKKQVDFLDNNPEIGLIYCGSIIHKITLDSENKIKQYPSKLNRGEMRRRILYTIPCITSTMMVRKEVLFQAGLFDETLMFWQETELMIRICQLTKIDFLNECLIIYLKDLRNAARLSSKYSEWLLAIDQIIHKHQVLYDQMKFFERAMQKMLYYADATERCLNIGNLTEYYKNRSKLRYYNIVSFPYRCYKRILFLIREKL
jgi:glycosyltransferase involved in cell wall biosynthesis